MKLFADLYLDEDVTHNRVHFELLHRQYLASGREHAGIVVATRRAHTKSRAGS